MGRKWSQEEIELLEQLKFEGLSTSDIAKVLGKSKSSINNKFTKINDTAKKISTADEIIRLWNLGEYNKTQIAEIVGCHRNYVSRIVRIYLNIFKF